jgi:hypothetical protein
MIGKVFREYIPPIAVHDPGNMVCKEGAEGRGVLRVKVPDEDIPKKQG